MFLSAIITNKICDENVVAGVGKVLPHCSGADVRHSDLRWEAFTCVFGLQGLQGLPLSKTTFTFHFFHFEPSFTIHLEFNFEVEVGRSGSVQI